MKKLLNNVFIFYKNNWFKTNIIVILIFITLFAYKYSLNGRYINLGNNDVLDTRTGKVYFYDGNTITELDFVKEK